MLPSGQMSSNLRIATLNIWNRSGPWERRLELIRRELDALKPDLLGLQEVLRLGSESNADMENQAREIAEGFDYELAYGAAMKLGGGVEFGNALVSRHPIVEQEAFTLPGEESGETRGLLYCLVDTPHGQLPVFVTHLNWKLHHGSIRVRQMKFVVEQVMSLAPVVHEKLPPVLMGDFNAEPDSDEVRFLRGLATIDGKSVYFTDAWIAGGDDSGGHTFDRKNRFAALAHEPPRRIDYIFVRGPDRRFRGEPLETKLAFATPDGDVWPSDHFGLVSEIAAAPREK